MSGTSSIVVLLGVLLGATLAGADWTAGTMGTLLTWEPRRTRVHLVRVLVTVAVVLVFTIFAQVLLIGVFRIAVAIAGSADGTPKGMPRHLIGIVSRVAVVAALFGVVAHAVATLGRSTVAALGVIFGYLIVVEGFVAGLWTAIQPRLLIRAAEVVISQQPLLGRAVITSDQSGNVIVQSQEVLLSVSGGWVVLGVWVVALTAACVARVPRARRELTVAGGGPHRRRDVPGDTGVEDEVPDAHRRGDRRGHAGHVAEDQQHRILVREMVLRPAGPGLERRKRATLVRADDRVAGDRHAAVRDHDERVQRHPDREQQ